ncbi:MAG: V-type ATP synthase subunit D [Candidatus Micrarchaeota archaeon]
MGDEVIPTRMELIIVKQKIALAKKGHKLLKQKRDALILEFFKILKKAQDLRSQLNEKIAPAYKAVAFAEVYHGISQLQNVSASLKKEIGINIEVSNIMGVKIPYIESKVDFKHFLDLPAYSISGNSAKIDDAVERFDDILQVIIKLAETETAIKRLILEIEKTKRRVNALEFVLLPKLDSQSYAISFRLDEMERDSFVSLKSIKRKLEKREKEN